jgi:hypothetical protein
VDVSDRSDALKVPGPLAVVSLASDLGRALGTIRIPAGQYTVVEVPGIEPGSFVALMGLLRAQYASSLLGPTDHAHKSV